MWRFCQFLLSSIIIGLDMYIFHIQWANISHRLHWCYKLILIVLTNISMYFFLKFILMALLDLYVLLNWMLHNIYSFYFEMFLVSTPPKYVALNSFRKWTTLNSLQSPSFNFGFSSLSHRGLPIVQHGILSQRTHGRK